MSIGQVLDMLKLVDVTIYAIGFMQHQPANVRMEQRMRLQQLASATGGEAYFPGSKDELSEMYDKIVQELNGRYTLGYVSSNATTKSSFRKVEIKVTNPALKGAKIRTRGGYYAPLKSGS